MASYLDKQQINTAITDNTKLDLSHQHITTANFMQLSPIMFKEMVPGERISVNVETFSRMNPMPVPTFGRANIKNRAFFVPYRTIFRAWNDFITDSNHIPSNAGSSYLVNTVPTIPNDVLAIAIAGSTSSSTFCRPGTVSDYDFIFNGTIDNATGLHYRKFNVFGAQAYKVLVSLGYNVNFTVADKTSYSALPLMAYAKIYADYYYPTAYHNTVAYVELMQICNYDGSGPIVLTSSQVEKILQLSSYVCYDSDYFVSAWDRPNQPNAGNNSNFKLFNIDTAQYFNGANWSGNGVYSENGSVTNNSGNSSQTTRLGGADAPFITPYVNSVAPAGTSFVANTPISEYLLHGLHALTDYMKRHQLSGSLALERYLARFGKALPAEKLNRSVYLGCQVIPFNVADVMSQSDTSGASLGTYAGRGMAYGDDSNFDFNTDEFGMFLVLSSIVPVTGYYQGLDRTVKHITKLDFWTPEFDQLGVQAIGADELYMSLDGGSSLASSSIHDQVFGFTPRYAEYKVSRDQLSGNFRVRTLNAAGAHTAGSNSYHLMREWQDTDWAGISSIIHTPSFVAGTSEYGQFNRIFYNTAATAPDQFTIIHNFNVASYSPMKPLYDTYDFEDKGKKVSVEVNGVKMN